MDLISSRQNALVKRFRELIHGRGPENEILLDGPHLLEEANAAGIDVLVAAFDLDVAGGRLVELAARTAASGARVVTMPPAVLAAASPVRHPSGVVAIARMARPDLDEVYGRSPALVLVLDAVQDPGNVGAIVRAAEACGATGVVAAAGSADPYGWKALRGAMGSTFRLPVATAPLRDAVAAARRAGLRIFATAPRDGTPLSHASLAQPSAIVLGGEGSGIARDVLDAADERLSIEMQPPVESLNVSSAAAIIVYEASRQRAHVAVR